MESARERLKDPLRRNADALIVGTVLTSALGLVFWALAARWLPASAVGIGAALMSTVALLANFATLGMRNGLVRFLPAAGAGSVRLILTSYAICGGAAMLAAGIFLAGQPLWAGKLGFLRESPLTALLFVTGTAVWVVFVLQDQVLIGLRRTGWVPLQNGVCSVLKIAALPLMASAAAWAVFAATLLPALLAVAFISVLVMRYGRKAAELDSRPASEARIPVSNLVRFAASDHLATLLWFATADVLTLMVLHVEGTEASAYWYIANTIGYSLYLVTSNVGSALIAESVHDSDNAARHARKALLHSAQLVVPAAVAGILAAPLILRLMGEDYAEHATTTLQLILASAIPQLLIGISLSTARVRGDMGIVVGVYVFTAVTTWSGSWFALHLWGITGIGIVILLNQILLAGFLLSTGRTGLWDGKGARRSPLTVVEQLPSVWRRWSNQRRARKLIGSVLEACGIPQAAQVKMLTSDSDTLVLEICDTEEPVVVKIAISPAASQGLDRHAEAVAGLASVTAREIVELLPRVLRQETMGGNKILVESRLPGRPMADPDNEVEACVAALAAMTKIHAATSMVREVDEAMLAAWIDEPLAVIRRGYAFPGAAAKLDGLSSELRQAWLGRHLVTGFVHGDFWTGNVLLGPTPSHPRVTGIVDWENANPNGLPDADLVHWWLAAQPGQLGDAVCKALGDPDSIRTGLAALGAVMPNNDLKIEHVVLLAWMGHVSAGLSRASTNQLGVVWQARNVAPVIRLFDADGARTTAGDR